MKKRAAKPPRIAIPKKIEREVLYKSKMLCYCRKKGVHIHHLNGDRTDNNFDNLIFVCFKHHNEAEIKGGLEKRPDVLLLKRYRDELYEQVAAERKIDLQHYKQQLRKVTEENLFQAALDAGVVLEIAEIRTKYFEFLDVGKRSDALDALGKYVSFASLRVCSVVIDLLSEAATHTRLGFTSDTTDGVFFRVMDFFPYSERPQDKKTVIEIAKRCSRIGANISYDAFIHLRNLATATSGLEILKFVYRRGADLKIPEICDQVLKDHAELARHLDRKERTDLGTSQRLLKAFFEDLNKHGVRLPDDLEKDLRDLVDTHRGKGHIERK